MSIAVCVAVHDGLVLAADSASSLIVSTAPGVVSGVAKVYENANKIFNLYKGKPIGCVTFGTGSIGSASLGTLMKDLRSSMMDASKAKKLDPPFDPDHYTMQGVSKNIAKFLADESQKQNAAARQATNIGFLVGGYSATGSLGESWSVEIKGGVAGTPVLMRPPDQPGINWGGASEVIQRICVGYSPALFQALVDIITPPPDQAPPTPQQLYEQLNPVLLAKLQAPIVFAPMPIQDAIELARFLVHSAIMFSRFMPGPQIVGGPIEIAAITKHEQFRWINRKHYYDQALNVEAKHVIVDR